MRLLIVEDDAALRDGLAELLGREGHDVATCGDGLDAFERCCRETFDLVVLDVGLPGLDGIECCTRLRHRARDMPIILLTALGDESDKVRGLEAGADDFVTKPFGSRELLARIAAVSRRCRPSGVPERLEVDDHVHDRKIIPMFPLIWSVRAAHGRSPHTAAGGRKVTGAPRRGTGTLTTSWQFWAR